MTHRKLILIAFFVALAPRVGLCAQEPVVTVECLFTNGVVVNASGTSRPTAPGQSHYTFTIPATWKTRSMEVEAFFSSQWSNLDRSWGGKGTAILNGRMLRLLETTTSDNAFYIHGWLDRLNSMNTFEALYILAGHEDLPKEYDAPRISFGRCRINE